MNPKQFRTKETFDKPTPFLKRKGIIKVGNFTAIQIRSNDNEIEICEGNATNYYHKDGHVEGQGHYMLCAKIPKELKAKVIKELMKR